MLDVKRDLDMGRQCLVFISIHLIASSPVSIVLVETWYAVVEQLLLVPLPLNPGHLTMFGYGKDHRSSYSQGSHADWDMHTADCGRHFGLTPPIQPLLSQPRVFGGAVVPKMVT